MEEFSIKGGNDNYLKFSFQEVYGFPQSTSHWGGFEVRTSLEIKSGNFSVKSTMWVSTGELYEFFKNLESANKELRGKVEFKNYERNLEFIIAYNELGHATVGGTYFDLGHLENELKFEFNTDQSYLTLTIQDLKQITLKYGDMKGIKK
jgi:hypothetical protein